MLSDGTRIINYSAVFKAFGRTKRGRAKNETRVLNMPAFIDANNLQPFVGEALKAVLNRVEYIDLNGNVDSGYDATIFTFTM